MAEKKNIIWTTGRRKTAVARVRMLPGTGTITVNERTLEDYFPRPTSRMRILEPFEATETVGQYDVLISVEGGGIAAQADAVRHGISRALVTAADAAQRRDADARSARGRAQEIRPSQSAQAAAVLQTLGPKRQRVAARGNVNLNERGVSEARAPLFFACNYGCLAGGFDKSGLLQIQGKRQR
jgi:ribosomal protein S9